jgi:hypothetical protein
MYRSNHIQQFILRHALENVSRSSGSPRALDLAVAVGRRQHDNPPVRKLSANCDQDIGAIGSGKPEVHQRDVGPTTTIFGYCLNSIGCLRDHDLANRVRPRVVAPGHCTGWRAKAALAHTFAPGNYGPSVVGSLYALRAT